MSTTGKVLAEITKGGNVIYRPDFLSTDPDIMKKIDNELKNNELLDWVPKNCGTREFVIKHEEGHVLWWKIMDDYPKLSITIMDIILEAAKSGELHKFCHHATSENMQEAFCDVYSAIFCMKEEDKPAFMKHIERLLIIYDINSRYR